jgi:cytochrome c
MKFSFWEKLGASVLATAWLLYLGNMAGNALVHVEEAEHQPEPPAHEAQTTASAEPAEEKQDIDVVALLATASADAGKKVFNKCKACHTTEQGGDHRVGPNLWEIVGRPRAGAEGFSYSDAMKDAGGHWGYEELNVFLADPKGTVPGTKMGFRGVSKPQQRADLIVYLRGLSANPLPLP